MAPTLAFRFATITVQPGDFNPDNPDGKFRRLNGLHGAHNRSIDPGAVKKLAADWKSVVFGGSPLILWQDKPEDQHFYVISGQHRLWMASRAPELGIPFPLTFKVEIRTPGSVKDAGTLVHQVYTANLHGRRQDGPQGLEIYQKSSPWVKEADRIGLAPAFTTEQNQNAMSWKAILQAALLARYMSRLKRVPDAIPNIRYEEIVKEFTNPVCNVADTLAILQQWENTVCVPTDTYRRQTKSRLRFRRHDVLTVALLIWSNPVNVGHKKTLQEFPTRLITAPDITQIVPKNADQYGAVITNLLAVANARRHLHRLAVFTYK